jgi:flagellar hook-associated protein 2
MKGGADMAYSAALNTVYNHYLQTYSHTRSSRYDAHKKSELRSIYNSIVEQNRKSPLYFPENNKESHGFAVGLKENARQLRNTIASLGGLEEGKILEKKTAFSSAPETVNVSFIGSIDKNTEIPEFNITVNRLATSQINTGHKLAANEKIGLEPGSYSFDLNIADTSYEFQFNINEGETNLNIQKRLARLFENADLGLTAKVIQDFEGHSTLTLEANNTGLAENRDLQFKVSDDRTSKTAGAVSYLGMNRISQKAGNAEFLLNGEVRAAHANHFTVEKMFEIQLTGVSKKDDPPVNVGLKTDIESTHENINSLINGYNEFIKSAESNFESHNRSSQIVNEMKRIAMLYLDEMESIGLTVEDDGYLTVADEEKLKHTILQGDGEEAETTSSDSGLLAIKSFTNTVLRKSNQIIINPMEYVDKKIIAYKNPAKSFVNPYMTSAYSGMMFNSFC